MDLIDPMQLLQPQQGAMMPGYPAPSPLLPPPPLPELAPSQPGAGYPLPLTTPPGPVLPSAPLQSVPPLTPAVSTPLSVSGEALMLMEEALGTSNDPARVLKFCLDRGGEDAEIRAALAESERLDAAREAHSHDFDSARTPILKERSALVDQISALIARQKEVRRVSGAGSPEDVEINATLKSLGALMATLNAKLDAVDAQAAEAIKSYPAGTPAAVLFPLYVMKRPGSVIRAAFQAITDAEAKAQADIRSLTEEDKARIEADKKAFQEFVSAQTEKRLAPAREKVEASKTLIAAYEKMKADAEASFQAKKALIEEDSNALKDILAEELRTLHPGGMSVDDAQKIQMQDVKDALNSYYRKDQRTDTAKQAIRLLNNLTNIDFELSQKEEVFKKAKEQIEIGQQALRWAQAFYESEKEKINSPYFEAECKRLFNEEKAAETKAEYERLGLTAKAQQERFERENSYRYQFNVIYSRVLDQKRRLGALSHRLEGEALRLEGVKLPDLTKLSYAEKKKLKAGAESIHRKTRGEGEAIKRRYIELNTKSGALSDSELREVKSMSKTLQLTRSAEWCLEELQNDLDFQAAFITESAKAAERASLVSTLNPETAHG